MTTLHLLRHAKSSWDDTTLPDVERPLAPRGRRAVALLQTYFAGIDLTVDLVLVSPAQRARSTWEGVAAGVRGEPAVRVEPRIYQADADGLLAVVRAGPENVASVLLVGHNPGFEELARTLVGGGDADALADLSRGYPTGGFASMEFRGGWADVVPASGYLLRFVRPRDLED